MAESKNLFALLDAEDDDASTIVDAALAAVDAVKSQALKKKQPQNNRKKPSRPTDVNNNHMMTKSNHPNSLPRDGSRRQSVSTKEKSKGEKSVKEGSVVANGNGHGPRNYYNRDQNNSRNYGGGFQGNSMRNFGGNNGYRGDSRGPYNQYRNQRNSSNDLQGNNVAAVTEKVVVDADGWQVYHSNHSRRRTSDNGSQDGDRRGRNFNGYGGDRRYRSNNGREDKSDVSEKEVPNVVVSQANNGETITSASCGVEAGKDSDQASTVSEGHKDGKDSKQDGHKAQVDSKKQDDEKILFTLKEYEKMQLEKRKALESLKQAEEERKVQLDKDFESMLLVEKKNDHLEEEVAVKQNSAVTKMKDNIKADITRKTIRIVLKPASFREERWEAERRSRQASEKEKMNNAGKMNNAAKNEKEVEERNYTKRQNYYGNGRAADLEATKRQTYGNGRAQSFSIDANQFPALGGASKC